MKKELNKENNQSLEHVSLEAKAQARKNAILYTCLTVHGLLAFKSGLILLYLKSLAVPDARLLAYLAIPPLSLALLRVPAAHLADFIGKKKLAYYGMPLGFIGFMIIGLSPFLPDAYIEWGVLAGIIIFAISTSLTGAGWFPLLDPIVSKNIRGRFFGRMRLSWQLVGFIFSSISSWILKYYTGISAFQTIIFAIAFMLLIRAIFYIKIPELEQARPNQKYIKLFPIILHFLRSNGYTTFGAYIFLLTFFTSYCPTIFSLMEKEILHIDNSMIVWLANLAMIGGIMGFWIGGNAVDKMGTKPLFLICHSSYFLILFIFVFRGIWSTIMPTLWVSHFLFGAITAASSIAITTEIFALMHKEHKAVGVSILMSFQVGGGAIAGFIAAAIIKLDFLKEKWMLFGMPMNKYDSILSASAIMIVLLITTLGLVPSVLRKPQIIPQSPPQI
jgi:MFS family permease